MAIVELGEATGGWLADSIISTIALVELKFGDMYTSDNWYYSDIEKVRDYIRVWGIDCQYYLGFISEKEYDNPNWLDGRQTSNWADKRVTVLSANYDSNRKMQFHIQSCNGLNTDL
jgi:hypothetical protein